MDQSLFKKRLQRPVNRNTIELLAGLFFDIAMRQRTIVLQEQLQYFLATTGNA
jgi:hypothetical protein